DGLWVGNCVYAFEPDKLIPMAIAFYSYRDPFFGATPKVVSIEASNASFTLSKADARTLFETNRDKATQMVVVGGDYAVENGDVLRQALVSGQSVYLRQMTCMAPEPYCWNNFARHTGDVAVVCDYYMQRNLGS